MLEQSVAENNNASPSSLISLQKISSSQYYPDKNNELIPILKNISLEAFPGDIWGISSSNKREADTLCQIIGNMTTYYSGRCRIGPIGTMQRKRYTLEHIFYIDTHEMIYPNMTVLELLMFITMEDQEHPNCVKRQLMFLDLLKELKLEHITLTLGANLLNTEKMLIELIIALFSKSQIIIFNAIDYEFSQSEIATLTKINKLIQEQKRVIVIATMQPKLIGMTCDHVVFIHNGNVKYCGNVEDLYKQTDKVVCMIRDNNSAEIIEKLTELMPGYSFENYGDYFFIHNEYDQSWSPQGFYALLATNNIIPEMLKMNKGRVENSFIELIGKHDI